MLTQLTNTIRSCRTGRQICGSFAVLVLVSQLHVAQVKAADEPVRDPTADSLSIEVDWNDPQLISVQNALLKTIESTSIAAEVAGRIAELEVAEGAVVKSNQAIGLIDDKSVRLQVQRARLATAIARHKASSQIDLQLAEKRCSVAKNEMERAEVANTRVPNSYPAKELDRLKLVFDTSELEIQRAKHEQTLLGLEANLMENDQKVAEELLARHQIVAQSNGVIVSLEKQRGEWVEPGMELLKIVKLDRLRIEGFISASQATNDLEHRQAIASPQLDDRQLILPAKVIFVFPEINPVNNEVRVFLEVDNTQGELSPGMRVRAAILPAKP